MTTPQNPWQSQGGQPQYGPPPGGFGPQGQPPGQGQSPSQGQPPYPQQGGYPAYTPYGAPAAPQLNSPGLQPPTTVTVAFWISIVAPLVGTVLTVVNFLLLQGFMNDAINVSLSGMDPQASGVAEATSVAHTLLIAVSIFTTVILVIVTGLWILFGFKMRSGRNWARVVLTIFAAFWVLNGLYGVITGGIGVGAMELPPGLEEPAGLVTLGYVQSAFGLLTMAAFIVLVYLKPSNWFFQAASHR